MDLKHYYQRLREIASAIDSEFAVIISVETPDGGKAGVYTEVPRANAARAVVDGRARLATKDESEVFYKQVKDSVEAAAEELRDSQFHGTAMLARLLHRYSRAEKES